LPGAALEADREEQGISPINTLKGRRTPRRHKRSAQRECDEDVTFTSKSLGTGRHLVENASGRSRLKPMSGLELRGRTKNGGPWGSGGW